jgi:hypothetical protein
MFQKVIYMELQFNYNNMIIPREMKIDHSKKEKGAPESQAQILCTDIAASNFKTQHHHIKSRTRIPVVQ